MGARLWRLEQRSRCHPYVNAKTTFVSARVAAGGGGVGGPGGRTTASMCYIRRSLGRHDTSRLSACRLL